jgi:hypothetical protein
MKPKRMKPSSESIAEFARARSLFTARLLDAMHILVNVGQLFSAAMLCAVAIDVLADARITDGFAGPEDYKALLRSWLPEYGEHADRFYAVLRCGLLHRLSLEDVATRDNADVAEGPIALGSGTSPPRLKGEFWIIDVRHLIGQFDRAYAQFCSNPGGQLQRNFAQRLRQETFYETNDGLVSSLEDYYTAGSPYGGAPVSGSIAPPALSEFGFVDPI